MISLKNKNIFIAGGSGYLGSVLCEEILKLEGNIFLAKNIFPSSFNISSHKTEPRYPLPPAIKIFLFFKLIILTDFNYFFIFPRRFSSQYNF